MASICSVNLNLVFGTKKDRKAFKEAFQKKIDAAEKRNGGVRIARNKWLFDTDIEDDSDKSLSVFGSARWCLEQEAMADFHKYLKRMKVIEYTCYYEETSDQLYGKYTYEDGELWDCYVGSDHRVWEKAYSGEEDYFDDLEHALDTEGVLELVA